MNIFSIVLQSVLALIGIGVLGFWILKRGIIPENILSFLSRLAIDIALPCVVFAGIFLNFDPKKMPDWWQLPLWWMAFQAVSLVLVLGTTPLSQKSTRSEFAISLFFQNGLFFPLIVINESVHPGEFCRFRGLHPPDVHALQPVFPNAIRKKCGVRNESFGQECHAKE